MLAQHGPTRFSHAESSVAGHRTKWTPEYEKTREVLRQWRIAQPLDRLREVRKKFADAGLNLFSYVWTVADDYTDTGSTPPSSSCRRSA